MKYFYDSEKWVKERRFNNFFIESRRKTDIKAKYFESSISSAFCVVGIFFDITPKADIYLVKLYGPKNISLKQVQEYANNVKQEFYFLTFDDGSLVVFKDEKIGLYKSEKKIFKAQESLNTILKQLGAKVNYQLSKITPDF